MKLRSIRIEKKMIPKWNGNDELPIDERVVIHLSRIPGTSEKGNYIESSFNSKGNMSISYNDQMMVAAFVSKIENLEIDESGKTVKIKNGVELSTAAHPDLPELFNEIREHLFPLNEDINQGELEA